MAVHGHLILRYTAGVSADALRAPLNLDKFELTDNQTLYIAGGAIVTGRVEARGDNIRILGRGLLENSTEAHNWKYMILQTITVHTKQGVS